MKLYSPSALCILLSLLKEIRGLIQRVWKSVKGPPLPFPQVHWALDLVPHKPRHCCGDSFGFKYRFCLQMVNTLKSLINWFFRALLIC